jgi:hypothetical protein
MIKGSSAAGARASIRQTLRGGDASTGRRRVRRRTKALVGWMLYCLTAVGGTAAAWTVRETLFPALGAPTQRSTLESPATEPRSPGTSDDATDPTGDDDISVVTARVAAVVVVGRSRSAGHEAG